MPLTLAVQILIARLGLEPHPEGGFYREIYRSKERIQRGILPAEYTAATIIYYLLADDAYSAWHRTQSGELWHFHAGDSLNVHVLEADGTMSTHRLGHAAEDAVTVYQAVVLASRQFAAERAPGEHGYAPAGCTAAPGFELSGFELADDSTLLTRYSIHGDLIRRLLPRPTVRQSVPHHAFITGRTTVDVHAALRAVLHARACQDDDPIGCYGEHISSHLVGPIASYRHVSSLQEGVPRPLQEQ